MTATSLERQLYAAMLRLRTIEEYIAQIYPKQEMKCPVHLYTGQEAAAVGACAALRQDDVVFTTHRSHGWYLAKGGDLNAMIAELYGRATGCSGGWGGSMHIIDVRAGVMGASAIVGGALPHAAGSALAFQMQGSDRVAMAGFGDSTLETGIFHESMNFAALKRLPAVFVCENNQYATYTHIRDRQPDVAIHARAASYGIPGVLVDGTDVIAVYRAAQEAVARARAGGGPTLIECQLYRWREHVGPNYDYDVGHRTKEELDGWMARCPIEKLEMAGVVSQAEADALRQHFTREMEQAIELARQAPLPTLTLIERD